MPSTDPNRGAATTLSGFDDLYGLTYETATGDEVCTHVVVGDHHKQPAGLVHGGVFAAMAESMASVGTWMGVGQDKLVAGMSNFTTFMRPITEGTIHAVARPRHRGRTTWIWDVECADDQERVCAVVRVTIAVREPR